MVENGICASDAAISLCGRIHPSSAPAPSAGTWPRYCCSDHDL